MSEMDLMDEACGIFNARLDLLGETCGLHHSKDDPADTHQAVDYLCQRFVDDVGEEITLRIPICEECIHALSNNEWVLLFCTTCCSSRWVCRSLTKRHYNEDANVVWMKLCPNCIDKV